MPSRRYIAYISYQHTDKAVAKWLHHAIETYRVPRRTRVTLETTRRLKPIFLDREELSGSADLSQTLRDALRDSEFLIVVCSPAAAASRWVNREVEVFKEFGKADRILCLTVAGEPLSVQRGLSPELECLPPALLTGAEPLAADLRRDNRHNAKLKIIAPLLGVPFADLRQRDHARQVRRLFILGTSSAIGCLVFAALAVLAWVARAEAVKQRQLAVRKSQTAERTADFLVSLFQVSNPSEAKGNSVTARAILDRGVQQIEGSLHDEPLVRAELASTLGEVYSGLGLYKPAQHLLEMARDTPGQDPGVLGRTTVSLANLEETREHTDRAAALYAEAQKLADQVSPPDRSLQTRIFIGRGEAAGDADKPSEASSFFNRALELQNNQPPSELKVRVLEQLATADLNTNQLAASESLFEQALEERIRLSGELSPWVAETLNNLGAVAYLRHEDERAEGFYRRALEVDQRVYGKDHPEVAVHMNNLALIYLERRDFARAIPMLEDAVHIQLTQQDETQRDVIFAFTNLGLAHMGTQDYAAAENAFNKALQAAVATDHRLHAPILADLADLECRTGRFATGLQRVDVARPMMAKRYPDDAWRTALVDNIKAECLIGARRLSEADGLITASMPILLKRWQPASLYGTDALNRAIRLYQALGDNARVAQYRRLALASDPALPAPTAR
jgi:tetratricopeptide (TPR) repeat protein